jgi:hypothetical protein
LSSVIPNPLRLRSNYDTKVGRGPVIVANRGSEGGKSMHVPTYNMKYNFWVVKSDDKFGILNKKKYEIIFFSNFKRRSIKRQYDKFSSVFWLLAVTNYAKLSR